MTGGGGIWGNNNDEREKFQEIRENAEGKETRLDGRGLNYFVLNVIFSTFRYKLVNNWAVSSLLFID